MALKSDRYEESTDISFFYTAGTASRGGVVCLDVLSASGAAMDQGDNSVSYKQAASTNVPVGFLLNDVVDKDLTRTHLNQYKDEVQKGGKVTVLTRGWVVTNLVTGTPVPGNVAYADVTTAGNVSTTASNAASSGNLAVGRFMSRKDADGYAKVYVNLPNFG
jgi:antitoxin (DNA-binding transcriptional repressor) of toxin-antitoxin stability system